MTTRTQQPSVLRFVALWCITSFVISFLLIFIVTLVDNLMIPRDLQTLLGSSVLAVTGTCIIAVILLFYAIPAGAVHGLFRGVLKRALQHADETASLFLIRYRLINFLYGCAVGLMIGIGGLCVTDNPIELVAIMGGFMLGGALISIIVGELVRPQFQNSIATEQLPPEPFPKRTLSKEEDELLDDAEEVIKRLQSSEAKRRWATLNTLGQLSEPEEHILGAVTVLAAYDPMDYVREAARADLMVWKKGLPAEHPDSDVEMTIRRMAQFTDPTAQPDAT